MSTITKADVLSLKLKLFTAVEDFKLAYPPLLEQLTTSKNLIGELNAVGFHPGQILLIIELILREREDTEEAIWKKISVLTVEKDIN